MHDERPRPSPRVEAELAEWEEYEQLPPLRRLPDFLSVDDVMALFPDDSENAVRDEIHAQLEGAESGPLRGSYLDPQQEQIFVLWVHGNLMQALAVYDGKRLASKREVSRGQAVLGDVVSEDGELRSEILIRRITSMSVCCHPMSLEVLRVSKRGRLDEVLDFPLGYAEVGPGVRWSFLNHFEFTGDRVVIHDVTVDQGPRYELEFDPRSARFQPTPATAKLLREERARDKAEDGDDAATPGGDPGY
jgi:hypothetical protein